VLGGEAPTGRRRLASLTPRAAAGWTGNGERGARLLEWRARPSPLPVTRVHARQRPKRTVRERRGPGRIDFTATETSRARAQARSNLTRWRIEGASAPGSFSKSYHALLTFSSVVWGLVNCRTKKNYPCFPSSMSIVRLMSIIKNDDVN
jgi:hypothetical protein